MNSTQLQLLETWNSSGNLSELGLDNSTTTEPPVYTGAQLPVVFVVFLLFCGSELINLIFGTLGSITSIYIFSKTCRRSSIDILLLIVSVSELALTISMIAVFVGLAFERQDMNLLLTIFCFKTVKAYLLVTIAAERYLAANVLLSPKKSRNIAIGVFLVVIFYHVIAALFARGTVFYSGISEETLLGMVAHNTVVYFVLTSIIPMFLLTVLHVRIIYQLYVTNKQRSQMTSQQIKEQSVATMLLLETIIFVLFNSLLVISIFLELSTTPNSLAAIVIIPVSILFMSFSSTTSPIIYYHFLSKYREAVYQIFKFILT